MDFLELQRDSRVTTGNSGCLLCWPRQVQSSIRVAKESWGLLSEAHGCVPVFLENLHGMSCSGTCWPLGGALFQCRYEGV